MRYYLAPWSWRSTDPEPYWERPRPDINLGGVDLRSLPQQGLAGIAQGVGFWCFTERPVPEPSDWLYLGDSLQGVLSWQQRIDAELLVQAPGQFSSPVLLDCGVELLTAMADPTGQLRAAPIMPIRAGMLEWHLPGHSPVWQEPFSPQRHPQVLEVLRRGYRELRKAAVRGELGYSVQGRFLPDRQFHRRFLQALVEKYRVLPEDLIPKDLPFEPPLPHSTLLTESFNKADADTLGPDLSWTELQGDIDVVSNEARSTTLGGIALARADSDLATDDHYVQASITNSATQAGDALAGVVARKNSSATLTMYQLGGNWASDFVRLQKIVGGTTTTLGSDYAVTLNSATYYLFYLSCNGSALVGKIDGTQTHSLTDTAITANLRCGIRGVKATSGYHAWDSFEAGDIAVGNPWHYYAQN